MKAIDTIILLWFNVCLRFAAADRYKSWIRIMAEPPSAVRNYTLRQCPVELIMAKNASVMAHYKKPFRGSLPTCFLVTRTLSLSNCDPNWFMIGAKVAGPRADIPRAMLKNRAIMCRHPHHNISSNYHINISPPDFFCEHLHWTGVLDWYLECSSYIST
jgi:hypothetical protein